MMNKKRVWWLIVDNEPVMPCWAVDEEDIKYKFNVEFDLAWPSDIFWGQRIHYHVEGPPICSYAWDGDKVIKRSPKEITPLLGWLMVEGRCARKYRLPGCAVPMARVDGKPVYINNSGKETTLPPWAPNKRVVENEMGLDPGVIDGEILMARRYIKTIEFSISLYPINHPALFDLNDMKSKVTELYQEVKVKNIGGIWEINSPFDPYCKTTVEEQLWRSDIPVDFPDVTAVKPILIFEEEQNIRRGYKKWGKEQ